MFNGIYGVQAQFQPTLPLRGATPMRAVLVIDGTMFQPTLPLRGATRRQRCCGVWDFRFNPRSPCGERLDQVWPEYPRLFGFQPTLPLRGATVVETKVKTHRSFQPTLPLRGATPEARHDMLPVLFQPTLPLRGATRHAGLDPAHPQVSTHAPLAGSDRREKFKLPDKIRVSTHAPLAGSDLPYPRREGAVFGFQPTLPLRGATYVRRGFTSAPMFQPTLPLRGATPLTALRILNTLVSTHAPLAGSDLPCGKRASAWSSFNPRSPCGERRSDRLTSHQSPTRFNPRSPCGERRRSSQGSPLGHCFNPRSPCGERQHPGLAIAGGHRFQPTLPLRGATSMYSQNIPRMARFQPTLPLRGATATSC